MTNRSSGATVAVQVLVAVLFLAVIGGSVGLVLGLRDRGDATLEQSSGQPGQGGDGGQDGGGQDDSSVQPSEGAGQGPGGGGASSGSYPHCEQYTVQRATAAGAQGDVVVVLYVQTDDSEVWICRDGDGRLFYQGHRGGPEERPVSEGEHWLFLTDVTATDDGYVADNSSGDGVTRYRVSRQELVIEYPDGDTEEQPVLTAQG